MTHAGQDKRHGAGPGPGDGRGQSRRHRQATPADRPTARRDLAPSAATLGVCRIFNRCRGMASDRRDGRARHEGGAERDHRGLAPAGNDAQPLAGLAASLPRARVPYEGNEYRRPAEPGCDDHDLLIARPSAKAPDRGVTRCQHHSPSLSASDCLDLHLTLREVEDHQERSPSRDLTGQDCLDAHRLKRADQVALRAEVDRICRK
jgi:hypothetical protein